MRAVELRKNDAGKLKKLTGQNSHPIGAAERKQMMKNFEDMQKMSKESMDATMKSFGTLTKASQAIATEVADYSKKSFEEGSKVFEKMLGAKSIDKALEIQTDYAKTAYEGFVAQATKIGELYADLAKETYKPFEAFAVKVAPAK
jgi:hypothetical protein